MKAEAYERFEIRPRDFSVENFVVFTVQNLKKGNQNLLELLEREEEWQRTRESAVQR